MQEESIENQLALAAMEDLNNSIANFETLLVDENINIISEVNFVQKMLPFFVDRVIHGIDEPNFINFWVQFAGGPYKEVGVKDSTGEVIFKIPPILNTRSLEVNRREDRSKSIGDILSEAEVRTNHSQQAGNNFIEQHLLKNKLEELIPDEINYNDYEKRWYVIFVKYGVLNTTVKDLEEANTQEISNLSDFTICDD